MRIDGGIVWVDVWMGVCVGGCGWVCVDGCVWVGVCVDGCVLYHPPSILTLTHSLRSFVASPVKSYGVNAGVCFWGACAPCGLSNVVPAVGGRYPPGVYF